MLNILTRGDGRARGSFGCYFIPLHFTVANVDDAVSLIGDIVLMRDQHNGVARFIQALKQPHDFVTCIGIERTGGFIWASVPSRS